MIRASSRIFYKRRTKMKKRVLAIVAGVIMALQCGFLFAGCSKDKESAAPKQFGQFSYYGKTLLEYAVNEIAAGDVLDKLVDVNINVGAKNALPNADVKESEEPPAPDEATMNRVLKKYDTCTVVMKYYDYDKEDQQTTSYKLQGTDYRNIVKTNEYSPSSQIIAKNLILFPELVNYMEAENAKFQQEKEAGTNPAPYKNIFTYHTDSTGNVIIQQRNFAEIAATVAGGVGCCYRQDIEIVYDAEFKIAKWQTSLGIYTATPSGTSQQGYILEMDFNWAEGI